MGCFTKKRSREEEIKRKREEEKLFIKRRIIEVIPDYESRRVLITQTLSEDTQKECILEKLYHSKIGGNDGNLNMILKSEIEAYRKIEIYASSQNCLPAMIVKQNNLDIILSFSCYKFRLAKILEDQNVPLIEAIYNNLENSLKMLFKNLIEVNKIGINHLNINPINMYFSDEGDMKLLNFIIPDSFKKYSENIDNVFDNIFYLNSEKINWSAPELSVRPPEYDREKVDVYAIGKFIEFFAERNDKFSRLSKAMTTSELELRPSLEDCLNFIANQHPKIELLGSYRVVNKKTMKSIYYECEIKYIDYFVKLYEVREIIPKSEEGKSIIKEYISNMKFIDSSSTEENAYTKIYEISKNDNMTILISEYYNISLEDYFNNHYSIQGDELWDIFIPLLYTLHSLHDRGIFHGFLCLQNFLITPKKKIKISGFLIEGKNVVYDNTMLEYLASNRMILAPELKRNQIVINEIDIFKTDVYALAISFYRLVSLKDFNRNRANHGKIRESIQKMDLMNLNMKTILLNMIQSDSNRYSIFDCVKFDQENR